MSLLNNLPAIVICLLSGLLLVTPGRYLEKLAKFDKYGVGGYTYRKSGLASAVQVYRVLGGIIFGISVIFLIVDVVR